jgi:hypothetical protein
VQVDPREIEALTREAEQYLSVGMVYRAELVNEQLRLRGAALVAMPKPDAPVKQKRTSTHATTRAKRTADGS